MEKFRISLLATVFGGVFLVLGKAILSSPPDSHKVIDSIQQTSQDSTFTPFVFPTVVPLPGWQQSFSKPLPTSAPPGKAVQANDAKTLAGRQYSYIQNNLTLDIQMLYVVNTLGKFSTKSIIKNSSFAQYSFKSPTLILRHQEGIGSYNLFTYQQRAYLNACINSHGGSTITQLQFTFNRYVYDTRLNRIMPWLIGQAPLKDRRCLWAHLSIPLKNSSPKDAYQILETAWFSWYQWWYPRFPKA